ncbi:MAG: hypothetical protein JKY09_00200 [Crocinitomicaceae bacterium]|nr:hypothetical protein [Crocinitomicaceae bacterium]
MKGWYKIDVNYATDEFVLTTPQEKEIWDHFDEMHKRKHLFHHYEQGMIYEWIQMVRSKINKFRMDTGQTHTWFKIDGHKYMMRVKPTGQVWLTMPRHTRIFQVKCMYIDNIDLVAIQDAYAFHQQRQTYGLAFR